MLKTLSRIALIMAMSWQANAIIIVDDGPNSTENIGGFEAQATWDGKDFTIALTNTSDPSNGGYITGFLLNLPTDTTFDTVSNDTKLQFLDPDLGPYSGAPYYDFDYGFALKGNFLGGGKPSKGIGVGETGTFVLSDWTDFPSDLDTADSYAVEHYLLDNATTSRLGDAHFLVRFRGFDDGGSDKMPGMFEFEPPPPTVTIPISSTLWLMFSGLVALKISRRKKS